MKLEQLYLKLIKRFPQKKRIAMLLVESLRIKEFLLKKLKLGKIAFEKREITYGGIKIYEFQEMRYTRQDTSVEDSLRLENQLKKYEWKWDFSNIMAFLILSIFSIFFLNNLLYFWCEDNLSSIFIKNPKYDLLINYSFESCFKNPPLTSFHSFFYFLNNWLSDALFNLCSHYNILQ